ncbi:MAG: ammonium transporter, Amt family [Gaiellaceae bacterium]|jgi:Amt family ammonium transporter|nr:ammonium transporter, Amt family [Gaiellaceae bacterium]
MLAAATNTELLVAASTIWVIVTAVLVMFMQAGFAFLEAGLTRMKNAGHIAGKNVLIFGICSIVYWAVGFGIAFGDGGWFAGTRGFFPSVAELTAVPILMGDAYTGAYGWFAEIPGAAGYLFEVVFAGVSLAIVWGAMAERAKLWVYFVFGIYFTLIYSIVSHWIWSPHGWLFLGKLTDGNGMQDFAGSTVVHYQGALAGLAGALILGPRIGKFGTDGRANPIPGHNIPFAVLGTLILWFGWFGFNPGSTLSVDFGGFGFFAYVATTTNIAAATGAVTGIIVAWVKLGKPDISMMLNGALGALVAITAASGFVAPWAAVVIGAGSGLIAVFGVIWVEKIGIDDPIGAVAVHGMSGVWGTLACGLFAVPFLAKNLATGTGGLVYSHNFTQLKTQAIGLVAVGAFTFSASYAGLWILNKIWGIRVDPQVESQGLDVHEHGMWGYPEFYIPVPGGYGTESHGHVGVTHTSAPPVAATVAPTEASSLPASSER